MLAKVVTGSVPLHSLSSAGSLGRVGKLMKRKMLAHSSICGLHSPILDSEHYFIRLLECICY